MKASMQFISDFTTLPKDVKTFCDAMTMSGSKVEAYEITGSEIEGVYTGKIKEIQKHPDADKLIVCQVDAGQDEMIQISHRCKPMFKRAISFLWRCIYPNFRRCSD